MGLIQNIKLYIIQNFIVNLITLNIFGIMKKIGGGETVNIILRD